MRARIVEATVLLVALAATGEITSRSKGPWAYLSFCALVWSGLRFGQRGASLAIMIIVGFTVWNTMHYAGRSPRTRRRSMSWGRSSSSPWPRSRPCAWLPSSSERERIAEQLGASRARVIEAADNERRRIERNLHDGAQQRLLALAVRLRSPASRWRRFPSALPVS